MKHLHEQLIELGYKSITLPSKTAPPKGYTGHKAIDRPVKDYENAIHSGGSNFTGIVGQQTDDEITIFIDIDTDDTADHKAKPSQELIEWAADFVEPEWTSSGANRANNAGIYWFRTRLPRKRLEGLNGNGVDILAPWHRYAIVGGTHPITGNAYTITNLRPVKELPELTEAHLTKLETRHGFVRKVNAVPTTTWMTTGDPCASVLYTLGKPYKGSQHNNYRRMINRLANLGAQGHLGVKSAIGILRDNWEATDRTTDEFDRMLSPNISAQEQVICRKSRCVPSTATLGDSWIEEHPIYKHGNDFVYWEDGWNRSTVKGLLAVLMRDGLSKQVWEFVASAADNNPLPSQRYGWLPLANGELNLKTGKFYEYDKARPVRYKSNVEFSDDTDCPDWHYLLDSMAGKDPERVEFLRSLAKYVLMGGNPLELWFIIYGRPACGKGAYTQTLSLLLGELAVSANKQILFGNLDARQGPTPETAKLDGTYLGVIDEHSNNKVVVQDSNIKSLVGGELATRGLYKEEINLQYKGVLIFTTNTIPHLRASQEGMDRRTIVFDPSPAISKDNELKARLQKQLSAILNDILTAPDLGIPQSVRDYTDKFFAESDNIAEWLTTCERVNAKHDALSVKNAHGYYQEWVEQQGNTPVGLSQFREYCDRENLLQRYRDRDLFMFVPETEWSN